jgi:sugar/nucleoside kinase (ribokinase family)
MKSQLKPVLCVGDLVADIVTSPVTHFPRPGESIVTDSISVTPGGNALNTAVALRRMGDQVSISGSIGDDDLGILLLQHLRDLGLDVKGVVKEKGESTASTIILRGKGEDRRYIMNLGVGATFTGQHIPLDLLPENGVVLAAGYLKLSAWDDLLLIDLLKEARKRKNTTILNVCFVQNSDVDPARVLPLLEYVDIFLPNQEEAHAITGESMIENQAKKLLSAGSKNIIITMGDKGLFTSDGNSEMHLGTYQVNVVDPSGCGDCFTAGLIAGIRRGWDLLKSLRFGSASGALGATALGCTTGIPPLKEIDKFVDVNTMEVSHIRIE